MDITPTNEDARLRALGRPGAIQSGVTKPVGPLEEITRPLSIPEKRGNRTPGYERRGQGDRRRKRVDVILDTRSHRERRNTLRRTSDRKQPQKRDTSVRSLGIDVRV